MPAGAGVKRQCLKGGYEVRGLKEGSILAYPKVASVPGNAVLSFHVACGNPAGAVIEERTNAVQGTLVGRCQVPPGTGWEDYQDVECQLANGAGRVDVYLTFKGQGEELLRLDRMSFSDVAAKEKICAITLDR
jgi:glucuronoarabinoxylan endo-1,4-beta-xylanase